MSNETFKIHETAIYTVVDRTQEEEVAMGTEHVEIIAVCRDKCGAVMVRPFHSEDVIEVHIRDLSKTTDVEDSIDAEIHDELDRFGA
jgi:hypothetical protein